MTIKLYSYANVDRSGKVRWTALELGLELEEHRVDFGDNRKPDYLKLNPYGAIPCAEIDGERFIESSAICRILAGRAGQLIPEPGPERDAYEVHCATAVETLEYPVVGYFLSCRGFFDPQLKTILTPSLKSKLKARVATLPVDDFLIPGQLTLADIFTAYSLRIAIQAQLIEFNDVAGYLRPLMHRQAAQESGFFESIESMADGTRSD